MLRRVMNKQTKIRVESALLVGRDFSLLQLDRLGGLLCLQNKKLLRDKTLLPLSVNTNKINVQTDCVIVLH